jgi:hypothetical protein
MFTTSFRNAISLHNILSDLKSHHGGKPLTFVGHRVKDGVGKAEQIIR